MNEEMNVMVNENEVEVMDNTIGETVVAVNEDVVETVEPKKNGLAVAVGIIAGAGATVATVVGGIKLVKHIGNVIKRRRNGQNESTVEAKELAKKRRRAIAMMSDEEINMLIDFYEEEKNEGVKNEETITNVNVEETITNVNVEETNANAVEQTA